MSCGAAVIPMQVACCPADGGTWRLECSLFARESCAPGAQRKTRDVLIQTGASSGPVVPLATTLWFNSFPRMGISPVTLSNYRQCGKG